MNRHWIKLFAIAIMALTTSLFAANDDELLDTVKDQPPVFKTEQNKKPLATDVKVQPEETDKATTEQDITKTEPDKTAAEKMVQSTADTDSNAPNKTIDTATEKTVDKTVNKTADKPQIPKRDASRFIPSESISEDLAVSFPVDI